jgi:hypothetical protein
MHLIAEVASLNSQLAQAGCPCNENLYASFQRFRSEVSGEEIEAVALQKRDPPKSSGLPGPPCHSVPKRTEDPGDQEDQQPHQRQMFARR